MYVCIIFDPDHDAQVVGVKGPFATADDADTWAMGAKDVVSWDIFPVYEEGRVATLECGHRLFVDDGDGSVTCAYCVVCQKDEEIIVPVTN